MSGFGVGMGDIMLVITTAWKLYKCVKDSSEDFRQMTAELMALYAVMNEMNDFINENGDDLEPWRRERLQDLIEACLGPLDDLQKLYDRYESLDTQSQRTWDRMHFGLRDIAPIRQRLVSTTTLLGSFNTIMVNSSTARIHKKLNKFMTEVQAGKREGSVVSVTDAASTIDSPDGWNEFRRELEDIGISADVLEERRPYIVAWVKSALAEGRLEEILDGRTLTPTGDKEPDPSWYHAHGDSDHDSKYSDSDSDDGITSIHSGVTELTAASDAFDADVRRAQNGRSVAELFDPVAAASQYSLTAPGQRPAVKRRTTGLVKRLFQKQTAIIQAASDGKLERVAELLSLGMAVDARDRWGWTALAMAGYGGHLAIARLLLAHGANLNNKDVDGDTPKSLATQRGHTALVVLFEQEEARRKRAA
ncbi:hypothetical protein C8F01DRAFT_1170478, partial [Mycena amicta]